MCYTLIFRNTANSLSKHLEGLIAAGGCFHKLNHSWAMCVKRKGELLSAFGYLQYIWGLILAPLALSCWDKFNSSPFPSTFCFLDLTYCCSSDPNCLYLSGSADVCRPQLRFKWDSEKQFFTQYSYLYWVCCWLALSLWSVTFFGHFFLQYRKARIVVYVLYLHS